MVCLSARRQSWQELGIGVRRRQDLGTNEGRMRLVGCGVSVAPAVNSDLARLESLTGEGTRQRGDFSCEACGGA